MRKPTDKCLLCDKRDAVKTNSHIIPAFLLKSTVGGRHKERSYLIDTSTASIDEFYGRDRLDNPTEEIKKNHFTKDYYLCVECEKNLGDLESRVSSPLTVQLRDPKFSSNYTYENVGGLLIKKLNKLSSDDFNVFFLSVVWRQAIERKIEEGIEIFDNDELEMMRNIMISYFEQDKTAYESIRDQFGLTVISAETFDNPESNLMSALNHRKRPYIFIIGEFLTFVYSALDIEKSKKFNPTSRYFHIPPFIPYINYPGQIPNIIFMPSNAWDATLNHWYKDIAKVFFHRLKYGVTNAIGAVKQSKKFKNKRKKVVRRMSRISKRKQRK